MHMIEDNSAALSQPRRREMTEEQNDTLKKFFEDAKAFAVMSITDLKKRPDVVRAIRFDVTPKMIMEPRIGPEGVTPADLKGFTFYIEAFDEPPELMIMKVSGSSVMTTLGKIEDIPAEMIRRAVDDPVEPAANKMYAITDEIRDWLREAIGL
jgi:hypothetical protein